MNLSKIPILVIDDFQNMRGTLRQMLLSIGAADIDLAANAEEALAKLRARRYGIVLCDYNLGRGMDGQQLLDAAREARLVGPATAFLMITAETSSEMVMGALERAPDAYLTKPLSKDLLRARLQRVWQRKEPLARVDEAVRRNQPAQALAILDEEIATAPGHLFELLRLKAELALSSGDPAAAAAAAEQAQALRPSAWGLTLLGLTARRRQAIAEAESRFREAIALTPAYMKAHDCLAELLEADGRPHEAFEVAEAAVKLSSKSLTRQLTLARLAEATGRWAVAERAWQRVIAIAEQSGQRQPVYYVSLAAALAALAARGAGQQALNVMKEIRHEFRNHPEGEWWMMVARLYAMSALDTDPSLREQTLAALDTLRAGRTPPASVLPWLRKALDLLGAGARAEALPR